MRSMVMAMKRTCRRANTPGPDEPTLDLSSLIDVSFLLLIYFLVTTTIQPREKELSNNIPSPGVASVITIPPMLIELRHSGEVVVNPGDAAEVYETEVNRRQLPQLRNRLESLSVFGADSVPKVLLKVDDGASQQRYIDVINCLADAGIRDIALID